MRKDDGRAVLLPGFPGLWTARLRKLDDRAVLPPDFPELWTARLNNMMNEKFLPLFSGKDKELTHKDSAIIANQHTSVNTIHAGAKK